MIKVDNRACFTCYNALQLFTPAIKVPVFAVFPARDRSDTAELEYKFGFKEKGIYPIFSDGLYRRLNQGFKNETAVFLLDQSGMIADSMLLKAFNATARSKVGPLNSGESSYSLIRYDRDQIYKFNRELGKLDVYDRTGGQLKFSIRSSDFSFDSLLTRLSANNAASFRQTHSLKYNKESNMNAAYQSFELDEDGFSLSFRYWNGYRKKDSSIQLRIESCMVHFDRDGTHATIWPIIHPDTVHESFFFMFNSMPGQQYLFSMNNTQKMYRDIIREHPDTVIRPLRIYRKKGTEIRFEKDCHVVTLPEANRRKYSENHFGMIYAQYPYFVSPVGSKIYHLETSQSADLIPEVIYNQLIDTSSASMDIDSSAFAVFQVRTNPFNQDAIVLYRVQTSYFLARYDRNMTLKNKIQIPPAGLGVIQDFDIDYYSGNLYFRNVDEDSSYTLPLAIISDEFALK
ncbi:MAG: hypothetical protein EOP52_06200 [Sphingobacteriales bacterium]|nr:MAG: hypothetical protein EOP52_06200 [Sphingobacteriales bacterium]